MSQRRGAIIPALFLIAFGGYWLAQNLGAQLPGVGDLWPGILMFFGLASLIRFLAEGRRDEGLVFSGVVMLLLGAFFFTFTLGRAEWASLRHDWPVFVLIGGVGFLAQWLARPRQWGLLVPAALALAVGGIFWGVNHDYLNQNTTALLLKWWPVGLIGLGLVMLARGIFRSRVSTPPSDDNPV